MAISKLGISACYFSGISLIKEHLIADHLSFATLRAKILLHSSFIALTPETIVSNLVFGSARELLHLELHPVLFSGLHRIHWIS